MRSACLLRLFPPELIGHVMEIVIVIGQAGRISRPVSHQSRTLRDQVPQFKQDW